MKKVVYFVRHGQSEGNVGTVYQALDSPLTEHGRSQASLMGERMKRLPVDIIIASPLQRAKETGEIIGRATSIPVEYSELFAERRKPENLSGKPHSDPDAQRLERRWEESLFTSGLRERDGENFDDILLRADRALAYLRNHSKERLLVATHGFFLRVLAARVLLGNRLDGSTLRHFMRHTKVDNTGISIFFLDSEWSPDWQLLVWNDHAHLG